MYDESVDKPGLALVQKYIGQIHATWRDIRLNDPIHDDLVCIAVENAEEVQFKYGPRADYVAWLEEHGQTEGPIAALRQPAGDVEPKLPRSMAMWVIVPTPHGVGVMRVMDSPMVTSKGGDA